MNQKRLIFAGTPSFAVSCLAALLTTQHTVCAVFTQPDRPAGRGRKLTASPVKQLALERGIPIYQPPTLKTVEIQEQINALQADLMIVVAYGLILPLAVLKAPRLGCLNVHASLLPRWRGAAPIQRALLAGDKVTGITLMQMDVGLDTGAILKQRHCDIFPEDTGQTLHDRLALLGATLLVETVDNLEQLTPQAQDDSQAIYASKLEKAEAILDWQQPAIALERQVRAFNPWPVAQTELLSQTLRIWEAKALSETHAQSFGSIVRGQKTGIDIATGEGILRLLTVQTVGKSPLPVGDFLNGHPEFKCN